MQLCDAGSRKNYVSRSMLKSTLALVVLGLSYLAIGSQPSYAIPAFARKYGLPCSACHIGWPILNVFGQQFRDNGYQFGNDKDSPIYQNPSYWPITFRVTPQWHLESQTRFRSTIPRALPRVPSRLSRRTASIFPASTSGPLARSTRTSRSLVLPSMGEGDAFHFEYAWVRFDNLLNSPWLNVKVGKFELDTLLSEKRFLTLSGVGGSMVQLPFSARRRQ